MLYWIRSFHCSSKFLVSFQATDFTLTFVSSFPEIVESSLWCHINGQDVYDDKKGENSMQIFLCAYMLFKLFSTSCKKFFRFTAIIRSFSRFWVRNFSEVFFQKSEYRDTKLISYKNRPLSPFNFPLFLFSLSRIIFSLAQTFQFIMRLD